MRAYLVAAPVWVQSVVSGVFFGATMTVFGFTQGGSWIANLISGVLAGVVFGLLTARFTKRDFGESRAELQDLPIAQRRSAVRAASRGPAPTDPVVRSAALRIAENNRDLINRRWRLNTTFFAGALVLYAVLALTWSPWWWLGFAVFAIASTAHLTSRRRVEHRLVTLTETTLTT